jgi:hypothetical protein
MTAARDARDLCGQTFGRLEVVCRDQNRTKTTAIWWICRCSCLAQPFISARGTDLRSGNTRSCGCLRRETASAKQIARWTLAVQQVGAKAMLVAYEQPGKPATPIAEFHSTQAVEIFRDTQMKALLIARERAP